MSRIPRYLGIRSSPGLWRRSFLPGCGSLRFALPYTTDDGPIVRISDSQFHTRSLLYKVDHHRSNCPWVTLTTHLLPILDIRIPALVLVPPPLIPAVHELIPETALCQVDNTGRVRLPVYDHVARCTILHDDAAFVDLMCCICGQLNNLLPFLKVAWQRTSRQVF